jgi:predicted AlkP superfamily phosphohydrolase/phosphomutase
MSERLARKVLLVGWDAADWNILTPLLDSGLMPSLQSVIEGGVMGSVAALDPMISPMLWTTAATGKRPEDHGVLGFLEPDPGSGGLRPVRGTSRTVKALWNILSQSGLRSNVVGWLATHPAESIDGAVVSDMYVRTVAAAGRRGCHRAPFTPGVSRRRSRTYGSIRGS